MSQPQFPKTCHVCGADVTHRNRHKNRHGQYLCIDCRDATKRSPGNRMTTMLGVSPGLFAFYVALALAGGALFYLCLGTMVDMITAL